MEFITPCHFGTEAVLKREIKDLGCDIISVEDGKVTFAGEQRDVARANVFLRTTERVMIKVGEFTATTFDELFEKTKALPWENYIPKNGRFWVAKATSVSSKLFSPSDIQSIMKKAMVESLKKCYKIKRFEEDGASYPIRVAIVKDRVTIGLDTTGVSLHKRGYRQMTVKAPITETLAAALIMLTPWKDDRILVDPFCGSGTFAIEAALMATDTAPGINRSFLAEEWENLIPNECWERTREEARDRIKAYIVADIQGYDIDREAIKAARANATNAGVEHLIHLQRRDVAEMSHPGKYGFIITNPPYGERLDNQAEASALYKTLGERFKRLGTWSMYVITALENAEYAIGRKADKNRKIYNGMMKTYFYQFLGPKPPKRTSTTPLKGESRESTCPPERGTKGSSLPPLKGGGLRGGPFREDI